MFIKALVTCGVCLVCIQATKASSTDTLKVQGDDMQQYNAFIAPVKNKINHWYAAYHRTSAALRKTKVFQPSIQNLNLEYQQACREWIAKHPDAPSSLTALKNINAYQNYELAKNIFDSLSPDLKNSEEGKKIAARMGKFKTIPLGITAPEFEEANPAGKTINTTSFRGKYLLIEFWASWCLPCRQRDPELTHAYKKFKGRNFEILGVSLDKQKSSWLAAIQKDKMEWVQVCDLQYWQNTAAQLYNVHAIPQNFLLDPDGKVIAKNIFDNDLNLKLALMLPKTPNLKLASGLQK